MSPSTSATVAFIPAGRVSTAPDVRRPNAAVIAVASTLIVSGSAYLSLLVNWRHGALFLVGVTAGIVLYHAAFGFTSAWRMFLSDGRSAGVRAQMLMLVIACLIFIPLLSARTPVFGVMLRGSIAPVGVAGVVGAFLFGLGMQLGGSCASGTLYTSGGGNTRMLVVLTFFVVGSVLGTAHASFWESMPSIGSVSFSQSLGTAGALALSVGLATAIAVIAARVERARHGEVASLTAGASRRGWLVGPWPLAAGAVGLVIVNLATLLLAGRPWGVTSAFALWGAKLGQAAGLNIASWPYWAVAARAQSLRASALTDVTTVMDIGIMLGALIAAGLAGRFNPQWRVPAKSLVAAVVGGLLLGYGARLASGCNIGAFFSGVASGSLHGWVWFIAAFSGTVLGARLRPFFGLSVERAIRDSPTR
jgi:uncharacterized membrane protein YedE/YeeE